MLYQATPGSAYDRAFQVVLSESEPEAIQRIADLKSRDGQIEIELADSYEALDPSGDEAWVFEFNIKIPKVEGGGVAGSFCSEVGFGSARWPELRVFVQTL